VSRKREDMLEVKVETTIKKKDQVLPFQASEYLRTLSLSSRYKYAAKLFLKGWTLVSISRALGVSREAVRLGVMRYKDTDNVYVDTLEVPLPPRNTKIKYTTPQLDEDIKNRLVELHGLAKEVRSVGGKYRKEAEEFTRLVWEQTQKGVLLSDITKALGLTSSALGTRLVRYGYINSVGISKSLRPLKHRIVEVA